MSLDISLETFGWHQITSANITHNIVPMWEKAGVYEVLYNSAGKRAKDVLPILRKGLLHMSTNAGEYLPLNPPNGWGDYYSALAWLKQLCDTFSNNPDATITISS